MIFYVCDRTLSQDKSISVTMPNHSKVQQYGVQKASGITLKVFLLARKPFNISSCLEFSWFLLIDNIWHIYVIRMSSIVFYWMSFNNSKAAVRKETLLELQYICLCLFTGVFNSFRSKSSSTLYLTNFRIKNWLTPWDILNNEELR